MVQRINRSGYCWIAYEHDDNVDDVGNLYETKEATFSYDEEGNLVQKVEKNGDTWKYEYYGNGMMSKVIKPDNTEVTYYI